MDAEITSQSSPSGDVPRLSAWLTREEGRGLAIEMVGVIAGVLIALFVNEAVNDWHKQQDVAEARKLIREEIRYNTGYFAFRIAVAQCMARKLDMLERHIEAVAAGKAAAPFPLRPTTTGGRLDDQSWQTFINNGVLPAFPIDEVRLYSEIYSQQHDIREWGVGEGDDWIRLALANRDPATLSPGDVTAMRLALTSARRWAYLQELNDRRQLRRAQRLGIGHADFQEERFLILNDRAKRDCSAVGMMPAWPSGYRPPANLPAPNETTATTPWASAHSLTIK